MAHRIRCAAVLAFVLAVAAMPAPPAVAQGTANGFDTSYLVPAVGQECEGVPQCQSQRAETLTVAPGERREAAFSCDADYPFFWNWDVEAHHQMSVIVRALTFAGPTVVATNRADRPGQVTLLLGCSKRPYERAGVQTGTSFLPLPPDGGAVREDEPAAEEAAAPAAAASDVCSGVPLCQVQRQRPVRLKPLQTKGWAYYCTAEYPFYVKFTKEGSCCTATENPFAEDRPNKCDVTLTNWKLRSEDVTVVLACSKLDPNGPPCSTTSPPVRDPKCPIQGKVRNSCSPGVVPVCVMTWEERCSDGRVFECTADSVLATYCYQCS